MSDSPFPTYQTSYRIAGGETTSTFLAATTYYLLQTPTAYSKLQAEIRKTFESYEDITAAAVQGLPYIQAVISEGLRMYPPGSQGFPRLSPRAGTDVAGYWVPQGVSDPWSAIFATWLWANVVIDMVD